MSVESVLIELVNADDAYYEHQRTCDTDPCSTSCSGLPMGDRAGYLTSDGVRLDWPLGCGWTVVGVLLLGLLVAAIR